MITGAVMLQAYPARTAPPEKAGSQLSRHGSTVCGRHGPTPCAARWPIVVRPIPVSQGITMRHSSVVNGAPCRRTRFCSGATIRPGAPSCAGPQVRGSCVSSAARKANPRPGNTRVRTQRPPYASCVERGSYCEESGLRDPALMAEPMRGLCNQLPVPRRSATRNMPGGVMRCMHPPFLDNTRTVRRGLENVKQLTTNSAATRLPRQVEAVGAARRASSVSCSIVATSPASVVRRTSRTSLRSNRRARCIVVRLSQITRSYGRHRCE